MSNPPSGTVTFLFTDIEGSARLWEQRPDAMQTALALHDAIMRQAIEGNNGHVFKTMGDAFCAAFATAPDALCAAITAQEDLFNADWGEHGPLKVRMALHTGTAQHRDQDYFGLPLNRVARLLDAAHGGQTLLSAATSELIRPHLPGRVEIRDMGEHRLKDMTEHIHQLVIPGLPDEFPRLRTHDVFPNNLPTHLTSFVGRAREIAEVKRLLAATHLLTITGAGGTGKTRITLQVAAELLENFADGVWFVELAPITDPNLIAQAVAAILKVPEEPGQPIVASLSDFLKSRQLLLVVDNCEHVIGAVAQLSEILLRACPKLRVLASSREALGIAGETTWRLPSLGLPPAPSAGGREDYTPDLEDLGHYEAVRLFVERAQAAQPAFILNQQNAAIVVRICQRLDGIPLALELAAARVRMLTVEQIAARLDDRFRLLTGGSRTALPRQQTLRALIDWSYDLLGEDERAVLRRLSVFLGGWSLEAAEFVCATSGSDLQSTIYHLQSEDVLDGLGQLVSKSLVIADEQGAESRYRMLETIRYYSRDRLLDAGEAELVRDRHLDYFLQFAEEAAPGLEGAAQVEWLERLEAEHDNLRAALDWAIEHGDSESALRLASALMLLWLVHNHFDEGERYFTSVLEMSAALPSLRAWALFCAGFLASQGKRNGTSPQLFQTSLQLAREVGDRRSEGYALMGLGSIAPDMPAARDYLEEGLIVFEELHDKRGLAFVYQLLGVWVEIHSGDFTGGDEFFSRALALRRELGDKRGIARTLLSLGAGAFYRNQFAAAQSYYQESLAIFHELGSRADIATVLANVAEAAIAQGDYVAAEPIFQDCLATFRELDDWQNVVYSLGMLAQVARQRGSYSVAQRLLAEALAIAQERQSEPLIADILCKQGELAYAEADYSAARALFAASMNIGVALDNRWGQIWLLSQFAALELIAVRLTNAAQLFGAAEALREGLNFVLTPVEQQEFERNVASIRAATDENDFATAWNVGEAMTLEAAVALALGQSYTS